MTFATFSRKSSILKTISFSHYCQEIENGVDIYREKVSENLKVYAKARVLLISNSPKTSLAFA